MVQFAVAAAKLRSSVRKTIVQINTGGSLIEGLQAQRRTKVAHVEQLRAKIELLQGKAASGLEVKALMHERIIRENELQKIESNLLTSESVGRQLSRFKKASGSSFSLKRFNTEIVESQFLSPKSSETFLASASSNIKQESPTKKD